MNTPYETGLYDGYYGTHTRKGKNYDTDEAIEYGRGWSEGNQKNRTEASKFTSSRGYARRRNPKAAVPDLSGKELTGGHYTHISAGNSKIGIVLNVNLTMFSGCKKGVPCAKPRVCYASKFYQIYPEVKKAWDSNLWMAKNDRNIFFRDIADFISRMKVLPPFFRWHVSGDFLDQNYLDNTIAIAKGFPSIKFLAFTKMHHLNYSRVPKNYQIIFSMWPGWGDDSNKKVKARAWLYQPKNPYAELRLPEAGNAVSCPGSCAKCRACWNLDHLGGNVVFTIH
jgi:hypothetical protein